MFLKVAWTAEKIVYVLLLNCNEIFFFSVARTVLTIIYLVLQWRSLVLELTLFTVSLTDLKSKYLFLTVARSNPGGAGQVLREGAPGASAPHADVPPLERAR